MTSIPSLSTDQAADLPDLPPFVLALLARSFDPLLAWLSSLLLRAVLARCSQHPLVRLDRLYDPAALLKRCAAYHHCDGPGAKPTYPVSLLLRAEIVRVWAGTCSDLKLEQLLACDLIVRWYVGLPLFAPSPDHSTLNRFHAYLTLHQPHALFDDVLDFLDRVDPEDPATTPQIVDTFALKSAAAPTSVALVLRGLCQQLLSLWQSQAPPALRPALADLDLASVPLKPKMHTRSGHHTHLQQAVAFASQLQQTIAPYLSALEPVLRTEVQRLLDLLAKVIGDETRLDGDGQVVERPAKEKGEYRLASASDVEATFRKHDDDVAFGYNAAIATTATRIRAAVVPTGSMSDSETPVMLLEQQREAGRGLPRKVVMDKAGGWGKTRARVEAVSSGQTVMVALIPQAGGADVSRFTPADFEVSADGTSCRCPNGVESRKGYASGEGDGVHFRFTAKQCEGCPLWERCRSAESKPSSHRTVYASPYQQHLRRAAAFNESEEGKGLLGKRWQVEPTVGWLVRYEGCRRARRVGQAAAQLQLNQACAMRNLWRYLGRVSRRAAPAAGAVCP
jgi:hypothetical protein